MRHTVSRGVTWTIALALLGAACGGDSTEPTMPPTPPPPQAPSVAGTYNATQFTLSGAVTGDVIAAGGNLTLTLATGGAVTGSLFIPASLAGGTEFNADMAGTYTVTGDTLRFTQSADSFVRDMVWTIGTNRLSSTGTFSGTTVSIVLEKT